MTQDEVAKALRVHVNTVRNWESERTEPRGAERMALATLLGKSVEWLRTGEGDDSIQEETVPYSVRAPEEAAAAWAENLAGPPHMGKAIAALMRALRRRGLDMDDDRAGKIVMALMKRAQETGEDPAEEWAVEEIMKPEML